MGIIADPLLYNMLEDYLTTYLPKQRCASKHTICAEKTSITMFLDYVASKNKCTYFEITLAMFDYANVSNFLDNMVTAHGRKASTRNHRLACLRAFVDYLASRKPEIISKKMELGRIPLMSIPVDNTVKSINENGIRAILSAPNAKFKTQLRDQFIMILLFDSAARADELLALRICDVMLGKTPILRLFGKGSKTRVIPLMEETIAHFKNYMNCYHKGEIQNSQEYLFYTMAHGDKHKMSSDNLNRLIKKYALEARCTCLDVPESVHPHMFRHSRAIILYRNGMGMPEISRFLGHANIETTIRFYARLDVEDIRQIMIKTNAGGTSGNLNASPYSITDEETLKRLVGLK